MILLQYMVITYDQNQLNKLGHKYSLRFIILHGSHATGRARIESDIDIAVLPKKNLPPRRFLSLCNELGRVFTSFSIDCKSLARTESLFRYQVVTNGRLLYGDHTAYEEYRAYARRTYDDARPLRELESILIRKAQNQLLKQYA